MIYLKWFALAVIDILLLLTVPIAAPIVAAIYRDQPHGLGAYKWGWIWGTYDNPPQGDEGYVRKRAPFPGLITGLRGYVNRVFWMIRNPVYGFARWVALNYSAEQVQHVIGKDGISDKDGVSGWYFVRLYDLKSKRCVGFEFYGVFPWMPEEKVFRIWKFTFTLKARDLRIRLGWKLLTSKFKEKGFAPIVNTFNPVDGYGKD